MHQLHFINAELRVNVCRGSLAKASTLVLRVFDHSVFSLVMIKNASP